MRALLDESLPRGLARHFVDLEVETVFDRGWQGLKNGVLLGLAAADFRVFLTADQSLQYQQHLRGFDIGVVVLAALSNRLDDLLPLVPGAEAAAREVRPGAVRVVRARDGWPDADRVREGAPVAGYESPTRSPVLVDDRLLHLVMERYRFPTRAAAVDYALERAAEPLMTREQMLAMRGTGWSGDLEAIRSGNRPPPFGPGTSEVPS